MRIRLIGFLAVAGCGWGQSPPAFEVASVKPVSSDVFSTIPTRSVGRITWTTDLGYLIGYAYRLQPDRILGAIPGSAHIYAVTATTTPHATDDEVRLMFRALLADRFQMRTHVETKEADRYVLSVGKSGLRITEPQLDGEPPLPDGRVVATQRSGGVVKVVGWKASMSALCERLERNLGMPVIDQTGLTGSYDFSFRYAGGDRVGDSDESPIFGAIQREMGLRLEKRKGPVEVLVVDHVGVVPTEN